MAQPIIHTLVEGFCTVCGETREWLVYRGLPFTEEPAIAAETPQLPVVGATVRIGKGKKKWQVRGYGVEGGAGVEGMVHLTSKDNKGSWIDNRHIEIDRIAAIK